METQQNNCNIGIIGDTQSGKTLFLTSLPKYSRDLKVLLVGQDPKSRGWLESRNEELRNGTLPTATSDSLDLTFVLTFNKHNTDQIQRILFQTTDGPGRVFAHPSDQMIEYLGKCRGFIILINPNGGVSQFDTIKNTLDRIITGSKSQAKLKNRISVCLTQFDNPKFQKSAKELVQLADENGITTPLMSEKNTFSALKKLFVSNGQNYGLKFLDHLTTYWAQEGINYFSISSLGFFVYPGERKVDPDHCANIIHVGKGGKKVLRNGFDRYRPVHLLKPINWILDTKLNTLNKIEKQ